MYRQAVLLLCCLCGLPAAQANQINVWDASGPYWAGEYDVVIEGPGTFKIEAREGTELGYINSITVAFTGDPGPVTIFICAEDHEELPGATNVWRVDLTGAEPGVVDTMRITGSLGHPEYASALIADSAGTISIGSGATGDIVKPVHILGDLDSLDVGGAILPEVTVDGDVGTLSIGTLSGEFRITSGNLTEAAWVTDLRGCFDVAAGDVAPPAGNKFKVTTLAGTLTIAGDLAGGDGLLVDDLRPQGLIEIGGSVLSTVRFNPYMSGTLHVVGGPDHSGGRRAGAPL